MTQKQARAFGVQSGYEAGMYGEFTYKQLADRDEFVSECSAICENKRQYSDSPTYDMANEKNSDELFESFEAGETRGAVMAFNERKADRKAALKQIELDEALFLQARGEFDGKAVSDLSEVPEGYRGLVLQVNDHGNASLYRAFACGTFREIASRV